MPRQLSAKPCEVTFYDKISDSRIKLFYRMPTEDELIAYTNEQVKRKGNKIKGAVGETRIKYGAAIMTGFQKGAFENEDRSLLSCVEGDEGFDANWKGKIRLYAPDIIEALAIHVFESSISRDVDEDDDQTKSGEGDGKEGNPT